MKPPAASARQQRLGLGGMAAASASARAPARSTCAPSRSRTPSAASRASSASAPGPGGTTARGRERGLERVLGGAPLELLAHALAQLRVARLRQPRRLRAGELQDLARLGERGQRRDCRRALEQARRRDAAERLRPRGAAASAARTSETGSPSASRCRRSSASLGRAVARRRRVEHQAAGDRGLRSGGAQDHAVAARRGDGLAQPQLGEAGRAGGELLGLQQRDPRVDAGRADEHLHERARRHARAARSAVQLDVEPVALGQAARACASVAPRGIAARSTPTRLAATRWPASRALDRLVVHLDGAHAHLAARRAPATSRSPAAIEPDQSVPVTTVPMPVERERAVDRQARRAVGGARLDAVRGRVERARAARRGRRPCAPRSRRRRRPRAPCPRAAPRRRRARARAVSSSTRSRLVSATTAVRTPSSSRIATCSRVCGITPSSQATTSSARSMPVAPEIMVRTKRSCPGTSTTESERPDGSARLA